MTFSHFCKFIHDVFDFLSTVAKIFLIDRIDVHLIKVFQRNMEVSVFVLANFFMLST